MWLKVEWFTDLHALPKDAFTVSECTLALGRVAVDVWILNSSCSLYYRWTSCCSVQVKTTLWPPGKGSDLPTAPNHHFLSLSSSFRVEHKQSVSVSFTELYPCTLSTVLPQWVKSGVVLVRVTFKLYVQFSNMTSLQTGHHLAPY